MDINNKSLLSDIPQEKIFVHLNSSILFSGEYLLYNIYCLNADTNRSSSLSKIAYVELIGSDKNIVIKHKIRLDQGIGNGDFFIPPTIVSGNYKLIAYTQWMRNIGESHFFQSDITIINPFNTDQNNLIRKEKRDTIHSVTDKNSHKIIELSKEEHSTYFDLNLSKKSFIKREKVQVNINAVDSKFPEGNYSISVRKVFPINIRRVPRTTNYLDTKRQNKTKNLESKYLPELRGELISGKVISRLTKKPVSNRNVALSIPGKNYILKVANTNDLGFFYFNVSKEYENIHATIQVIDGDNYEIELTKPNDLEYDDLKFSDFKITPEINDLVLQRSIYTQIENAYQNEKLNIFDSIQPNTPFFQSNAIVFNLDDYTRFPTMKETIVEIIDPVYVTNKKGVSLLHIKGILNAKISPLVLFDGVIIEDHSDIINYSARKIKSISLIRSEYIYSTKKFNGILSFETIDGDYKNNYAKNYIKKIKLHQPLRNKIYFEQHYNENDSSNRIPDFRNQLLWKPKLKIDSIDTIITFYTSDNDGVYEICLEGFTKEGQPVSIRKTINVN